MVIQKRISAVNAKKGVRLSLNSKEFSNVICGFRILLNMSPVVFQCGMYWPILTPLRSTLPILQNMLKLLLLLTFFSALHSLTSVILGYMENKGQP
jgi:hypothetical protein